MGGAPLAGNFTYAAHHAFFAGFLPTPISPGPHPRLFAARFEGSETIAPQTCVFDSPDIVTGLAQRGYHTVCIGGVGFFNKQNPLGRVLPSLFAESHWSPRLGVTDPGSTENQARLAVEILASSPKTKRVFLFINVSALRQPNHIFLHGAERDSVETQAAAPAYVDGHLPAVFDAMRRCHFIREVIGNIYEPGFENALRETPCANATCGCHIGYVHMDELKLYEVFGEGVLKRIPAGRV